MADEKKLETITGPASAEPGLDLAAKPLLGIKLKKEVGVAAVILIAVMVLGICYSLYHRGDVSRGGGEAGSTIPSGAITPAGESEATRLEQNLENQRDVKLRAQAAKDRANGITPAASDGAAIGDGAPPVIVRAANGDTVKLPQNGQRGGVSGGGGAGASAAAHTPTPEEIYRQQQLDAYRKALEADTAAASSHGSGGFGIGGAQAGTPQSSAQLLGDAVSRAAKAYEAQRGGTGGGSETATSEGLPTTKDQNEQDQKTAFASQSSAKIDTLATTREAALSPYEIRAGWDIPATLDGTLNSDLPGNIKAIVRQNVYDTATGHHLLIPQGSRIVGIYSSSVTYGQGRVQVVWTRLIYPDGTAVSLGNMPGVDVEGQSGFHDIVNNHFLRLVSEALLASAFAAGVELSQRQNTSLLSTPSTSQVASQAIGQQMGQLGSQITNRNLNIQPTIIVRTGYRFNVRVTKDIVFAQPYTPLY
jgi:type IV secretion system protein VirB10